MSSYQVGDKVRINRRAIAGDGKNITLPGTISTIKTAWYSKFYEEYHYELMFDNGNKVFSHDELDRVLDKQDVLTFQMNFDEEETEEKEISHILEEIRIV